MNPRRVTVRDIAKAAGVHFTTVSRALKRHASIPACTCDRIQKLAKEMGYSPDPMIAALNAYRVRVQSSVFHGNIAWLTNGFTRDGWNTCKTFALLREGAEQRATELGYKLEDFWLREPDMTGKRIAGILAARNIRGLILPPQPKSKMRIQFDWSRFAAVTFGFTLAHPVFHTVNASTYSAMQTAIRHARALGYRRLGLIISPRANERVNHTWLAAFLERQHHWSRSERVPVCMYDEIGPSILAWIKKTTPDVVICHEPRVYSYLIGNGYRIPNDFGYLTPSLGDYPAEVAGINENALQSGVAAVNLVVGMIHQSEWGIPHFPQQLLTEGSWHDGTTLPRKNF